HGEARGDLLWPAMGHQDAVGALALAPTALGLPLFDGARSLTTCSQAGGHTPQDDARWDDPDGAARHSVVAEARSAGGGRRRCLCDEAMEQGQEGEGAWYGRGQKRVRGWTDGTLWPTPGAPPLAVRWRLVVDPGGHVRPGACCSTDRALAPPQIVA